MISCKNTLLISILHKSLRPVRINPVRLGSGGVTKIGRREIVGFGYDGDVVYFDSHQFPFPPCRYREITPELKALREKEKGDWKALSKEEKKCLYRVSFCQTFAEMNAPTGEWKRIVAGLLTCVSIGIWLFLANLFIYDERPETFSEERQKAQLRRILDLKTNPVTGISTKWDYENNTWKQ